MYFSQSIKYAAFLLTIHLACAQDPSDATFDPLTEFCRRFAHRTTQIDRRIYIDGGYVDYGGGVYPYTINYTNTYLLYLDLDDIQATFPVERANLSKPSYVPSLIGGTLWADTVNKYFYMYGGEYNWTTSPAAQFSLWYYDALYDKWNSKYVGSNVSSVSFGASAVVDDRALAYYYGGWLSNATVLGWTGNPVAQAGLITYNMINDEWQNNTGFDSIPRAEGVLFYIPASGASSARVGPGNEMIADMQRCRRWHACLLWGHSTGFERDLYWGSHHSSLKQTLC